jgi:integrase/recombinase XerC
LHHHTFGVSTHDKCSRHAEHTHRYSESLTARYLRARAKRKGATDLPQLWMAERGGRPLTPNGIKIMLKRRGAAAGVTDTHAHRWRHNFAHEWHRAGGNTGDLMLLLELRSALTPGA